MSHTVVPAFHPAVKRMPSRTNTSWVKGLPVCWVHTSRGLAGLDRSTVTTEPRPVTDKKAYSRPPTRATSAVWTPAWVLAEECRAISRGLRGSVRS